jgi:hypothetical protein
MRRIRWLWVVLLSSSLLPSAKGRAASSARVAVMAHDPRGSGTTLARGVAERLRARGVDAVAVAAPLEQVPKQEDVAARQAGASRLVVLDLRTQTDRKAFPGPNPNGLRPGTPEHPYDPNFAAGPMLIGPTMAPAGKPEGAWGDPSEENELYVYVPQLPYGAGERPTQQRVIVQTETHLVARAVGASKPEIDETLSIGGMTSWRVDLARGSNEREEKMQYLWNQVLGEVADRSATALLARR